MTAMYREIDIRQSEAWSEYLGSMGWLTERTSSGAAVYLRKFSFGSLAKVQRPSKLNSQDLKEILEICKKNKALFVKIEPDYSQDLVIFKEAGFKENNSPYLPPSTVFVNLENTEQQLWNGLCHNCRYSVNKAKKEGVRVEFFPNPSEDILRQLQDICEETGKAKHFYTPPYTELLLKARAFKDKAVAAFVYDQDNHIVGAKLFLGFNDMVLYNMGGTTALGRTQHSGYLFVWEAFLYFKKLGYKILDQEGKDDKRFRFYTSNWGGFSHFKEKFGGEVVEFPVPYLKYLNPVLRVLSKLSPISV